MKDFKKAFQDFSIKEERKSTIKAGANTWCRRVKNTYIIENGFTKHDTYYKQDSGIVVSDVSDSSSSSVMGSISLF